MAHRSASNEPDQPNTARGAGNSASLIRVAASAQQTPGALLHCPVCGQPYTSESLPALPQPTGALSEERLVLCCAYCGTYSVGLPGAEGEAGSALASQNAPGG